MNRTGLCQDGGIAPVVLLWVSALAMGQSATRNPTEALKLPDLRRQFIELVGGEETEAAIVAGEEYLRLNRWDGEVWFRVADAQLRLGRWEPAIVGFRKANELGFTPNVALYNIACALAVGKQDQAALDALQAAMDAGFVATFEHLRSDKNLDSIRSYPRFSELTGLDPRADVGRDEKWQYDIDFLRRRLENVHFHLYHTMTREWFQQAIGELKRDVPTLNDIDIQIRLQIILAAVGDGHTKLLLPDDQFRTLPLRFDEYADGLFVRATTSEHRELAGSRVLGIGRVSAEQALQAVRLLVSRDNEQGYRYQSPWLLSYAEVLQHLGLIDDSETIPVRLRKASGDEVSVDLSITAGVSRMNWVPSRPLRGAAQPLYLRHREKRLHFEYLTEDRIAYLRLWVIGDAPEESMAQFAERVFTFIAQNDVAATVIDIRQNTGGNNYLNRPLVDGLLRCEKALAPGKLFVIADRWTFSAAMDLLASLRLRTSALLVGEPSRGRPNGFGESTRIVLPYSQVTLTCSSLCHQYSHSKDLRTVIAPDLPAELTSDDFRNNRDPSLELIRAYIRARGGSS